MKTNTRAKYWMLYNVVFSFYRDYFLGSAKQQQNTNVSVTVLKHQGSGSENKVTTIYKRTNGTKWNAFSCSNNIVKFYCGDDYEREKTHPFQMEELNYWSAETSISAGDSVENGFSMGAPQANNQATPSQANKTKKRMEEREKTSTRASAERIHIDFVGYFWFDLPHFKLN